MKARGGSASAGLSPHIRRVASSEEMTFDRLLRTFMLTIVGALHPAQDWRAWHRCAQMFGARIAPHSVPYRLSRYPLPSSFTSNRLKKEGAPKASLVR